MTDNKQLKNKKGEPINDGANYDAESRTVQVLQVLKSISDEQHTVRQSDILKAMQETKMQRTDNPATLSKTIDRIILQINPPVHTDDNDEEYRIKYKGYDNKTKDEHIVIRKQEKTSGKAPSVTDLQYIHDFDMTELDMLMDCINFSSRLSLEEKESLMRKLQATASKYYSSPYYDADKGKVKFYDFGIYSRLDARTSMIKQVERYPSAKTELIQSIKAIQRAINDRKQIEFDFCEYTKDHSLKKRNEGWRYTLSPYYIVVYHEFHYLICSKPGTRKISHYRIDLMSNVTIATDDKGNELPAEPIRDIKGLPPREEWDPEKYMREHLYMFYDEPRNITLLIPSGNHTAIHDHFGDRYRTLKCDREGCDKIEVRCSAEAMAIFAMQYARLVEVLDEDVRELIKEKMKDLDKYKR